LADYKVLVTSWAVEETNPELDRLRAIGCEVVSERRASHHSEAEMLDLIPGVDAVIGDHTNFQVSTTRPNGLCPLITSPAGVASSSVVMSVCTYPGATEATAMPWRAPQVKEKNPRTSATAEASRSGGVPGAIRSRPATSAPTATAPP